MEDVEKRLYRSSYDSYDKIAPDFRTARSNFEREYISWRIAALSVLERDCGIGSIFYRNFEEESQYEYGRHYEDCVSHGLGVLNAAKYSGTTPSKKLRMNDDSIDVAVDYRLTTNKKTAFLLSVKGHRLRDQGRYYDALKTFEVAIEIEPTFRTPWWGKGQVLYDLGRYEDALKALDKAIQLDPEFFAAWNDKGNVLIMLGRTKEADAAFAKAEELKYTS